MAAKMEEPEDEDATELRFGKGKANRFFMLKINGHASPLGSRLVPGMCLEAFLILCRIRQC